MTSSAEFLFKDAMRSPGRRVLLVEDEEAVRAFGARALTRWRRS